MQTCYIVYYTLVAGAYIDDVHMRTLLSYAVCYYVRLDISEVGHDYQLQIQMYLRKRYCSCVGTPLTLGMV